MRNNELIVVSVFVVFWLAVFSFEVGYLVVFLKKKIFSISRRAIAIHILAVLGILSFVYGYFIEPYWIDIRHIEITTDKFRKTDLTIVQISDLHCDEKVRNEDKLPGIINAFHPDIVVFTGDALNTSDALPTFKRTMSELKAHIGKYAVRGNFDVWHRRELDLFGGTGFIELDGQVVSLSKNHEKFTVSGVSVDSSPGVLSFLDTIQDDAYNILLFHYPGINEGLGKIGVDLFLAGHVHGGQVAFPFYGALLTLSKYGKKYEFGRYNVNGKILYVNRGIGMEGGLSPRVRFFARPEITVFHIRPVKTEY